MPFMLLGLVWLLVAIVAAATGATSRLQPPAPQLILLALTVSVVAAGRMVGSFHRWLMALDWRVIVSLHGQLPYAFAVPGGIGDVVIT